MRINDSTPLPNDAPDDIETRSLANVVRPIRQPSPGAPMTAVVGHEDVVEEDLVEHGRTGELAQRADVEPLGVHVDDEVGDAGVLGRIGVGAGQADAEVGHLGQRRPHLLPVQHVAALDPLGPRAQRGEVRAGARLAEELAPAELAEQRRPHPALLLLRACRGR